MDTSVRGSASRCCSVAPSVSTTTLPLRLPLRKSNRFCFVFFTSRYFHFLLALLSLSSPSAHSRRLPSLCWQVHPRLHLFMGDPGPDSGHVTWHLLPLHPQRDAASPHAASVRTGGSRTQLGGDLLGGHPHLHMVSRNTLCFQMDPSQPGFLIVILAYKTGIS